MTAIADTGFVVVLAVKTDEYRERCRALYRQERTILLPQSVLTESAYLITVKAGSRVTARFLAGLPAAKFEIVPLLSEDIKRVAEILDRYADSRIDFVDASVFTVAERLNVTRILTLDRRDFDILRRGHRPEIALLP